MATFGRLFLLCFLFCTWMHTAATESLCVQGDWNYPPCEFLDELDSLGLHLIDSLVSQLHGSLDINSQGGTTYTISFIKH